MFSPDPGHVAIPSLFIVGTHTDQLDKSFVEPFQNTVQRTFRELVCKELKIQHRMGDQEDLIYFCSNVNCDGVTTISQVLFSTLDKWKKQYPLQAIKLEYYLLTEIKKKTIGNYSGCHCRRSLRKRLGRI